MLYQISDIGREEFKLSDLFQKYNKIYIPYLIAMKFPMAIEQLRNVLSMYSNNETIHEMSNQLACKKFMEFGI